MKRETSTQLCDLCDNVIEHDKDSRLCQECKDKNTEALADMLENEDYMEDEEYLRYVEDLKELGIE